MATLVELAKNPIKAGDHAPNWKLTVGGEDISDRLISAEVTFSSSGESGMTMMVGKNLYAHSRERQFVSLEIGYGNTLAPFFLGRLSQPKDHRSGLYSEATAYGPSGDLGGRYFRGRVSYANIDAEVAAIDIWNRAMGGDNSSALFTWDAPSTVLEGDMEQFGLEHSFLEALQATTEPLGLVACDMLDGNFVVTEPMKQGALVGGGLNGTWGEGSYPKDPGFSFGESQRNIYNSVVVFRRSEEYAGGSASGGGAGTVAAPDGTPVPAEWYGSSAQTESNAAGNLSRPPELEYAVYAERPVGDSPFRRRSYIIPDYPGRQADAQALCEKIAATLNLGIGNFEIQISPCDYNLYELFGVEREEQTLPEGAVSGPLNKVLYACQAQEITATIGPQIWQMTVSGMACERERTLIRPGGIATGSSSGVV